MSPFEKRSRRVAAIFALLLLLLGGFFFWKREWILTKVELWLQKRVIRATLAELQPSLPFLVEELDFDATWSGFRQGRIEELRITISRDGWRLRMAGPLDLDRLEDLSKIRVRYGASGTLESPWGFFGVTPFTASLDGSYWLTRKRPEHWVLSAQVPELRWSSRGSELKGVKLVSRWNESTSQLELEVGAESLESHAAEKPDEHAAQLQGPWLKAQTALVLEPQPQLGREVHAKLGFRSIEALWDDLYLDLPGEKREADLKIQVDSSFRPLGLQLRLREAARILFEGAASFEYLAGGSAELDWKLPKTQVSHLLKLLGDSARFNWLTALQAPRGTLETEGRLRIAPLGEGLAVRRARGKLFGKAIDFNWRAKELAIRGAEFRIPFDLGAGIAGGSIEVQRAYWKRLKGKLSPMRFSIRKRKSDEWNLEIPAGIPLTVEELPLSLGPVQGVLGGAAGYDLNTQLELKTTPAGRLAQGLCLIPKDQKRIPPLLVSIRWPSLQLTSSSIEPDGPIHFDLFDGFIRINEIGLYDLNSEVPEIHFDARWDGIRLDRLGGWLYFGNMDGIFQGYAQDVVLQSWYPTRYELRAEVKPYRKSDIVFSPEAMRNFVTLMASESLDALPGIANWLAFGWPSRLFGGYDIDYAGIQVSSLDGLITLQTLDPPKILQRERRHFILYGPRFKMPLRSSDYPLVVDATAMGNFVRQVIRQLETISKKESKPGEKDDESEVSDEKSCLPTDLP